MKNRMIILTTILMISITGCGAKPENNILFDTATDSISGTIGVKIPDKIIENSANEILEDLTTSEITKEETKSEVKVIAEKDAAEAKKEKEEAERKAKEEAEKKQREAEEKAKAEAEKKQREEEKAKKEADKKAPEKVKKQENNTSSNSVNNNTSNSGNSNSGNQENSQPVQKRADTVNASGIQVYITSSVSDSDYNTVISWVNNMPAFLRNHVSTVNVVDNIQSYTARGEDASGVTKSGCNIYLKASGISGRKGSLYHEAGHCLDFYGGYSNSSTWKSISQAEWAGEGYYADSEESFAEAISRYYVDGLGKAQSKAAIESLINTGSLGAGDGFNSKNITLYAKYKAIWVYSGPNDFYGKQIGTVEIGSSVQATGLNGDNTWYKVNYNGQTGYVRADMISLES